MSVVTTPTVGRKVWYRPSSQDFTGPRPMIAAGTQPLDATVIAVWGDRCVNVSIIDVLGNQFVKASIRLKQADDDNPLEDDHGRPLQGYVEWMPYQKVQAEKHAAT